MYIVLVYDIKLDDKGSKVLSKVYKICKKYLSHIQNSVFEGEITASKIVALQMELNQFVRKDLDSVIIFKSRNQKWMEKEFWGKVEDKTSFFI